VKFVEKFGFEEFDWLMEKDILQEDDILTIINEHEGNLNMFRRALKGWYKPRVLLGIRSTLKHAEEIQEHAKNYPDDPKEFEQWNAKLVELENKGV
jgi:hypothetical protein